MRKTNDFDHDWNDVTIFEKLPVRKVAKKAKKQSVTTGSVTARRHVRPRSLCRDNHYLRKKSTQ